MGSSQPIAVLRTFLYVNAKTVQTTAPAKHALMTTIIYYYNYKMPRSRSRERNDRHIKYDDRSKHDDRARGFDRRDSHDHKSSSKVSRHKHERSKDHNGRNYDRSYKRSRSRSPNYERDRRHRRSRSPSHERGLVKEVP